MNFALLLILSAVFHSAFSISDHYSQTHLQTRPCYANIYAQTEFWNELAFEKESCKESNFQCVAFFQKSTKDSGTERGKELSQYFLMKDKSCLTVLGDSNIFSTQQKLDRDIRAEWLGLPSTFKGTFTLFPTQEQMGYMLEVKKCFRDIVEKNSFFSNFWFGSALYLSSVENRLNMKQDAPTGSTLSIIGQLSRTDLKAGRFTCGKRCSVGFTELRLKVGSEFNCTNDLQIALTSFFLIPISHKPYPTHVFDTVRGFNGHAGWGSSLGFQFPINNRCSAFELLFFANGENIFFFKNKEDRVLDLTNKPWSRFMMFNKNNGQTNIPAMNVLTQRVQVHPYNFVDIAAGFKVRHKSFVASLSYGLWVHPSERLELVNQFQRNWGIAAPDGSPLTPAGIAPTSSTSTIRTQDSADIDSNGNTEFEAIDEIDLDLKSGAARSALTQKAQAAIGMVKNGKKRNVGFGVGAFVELPHNNSALENWGFWAKVSASF